MVAHHRPPAPERTVPHARDSLLSHIDHPTGVGHRSNPATRTPGCRRTVRIMRAAEGSGKGHPLSGTKETWLAPNVLVQDSSGTEGCTDVLAPRKRGWPFSTLVLAPLDSIPNHPPIGFVSAPPPWPLLTQVQAIVGFAPIPNWLCSALFVALSCRREGSASHHGLVPVGLPRPHARGTRFQFCRSSNSL